MANTTALMNKRLELEAIQLTGEPGKSGLYVRLLMDRDLMMSIDVRFIGVDPRGRQRATRVGLMFDSRQAEALWEMLDKLLRSGRERGLK